MSPMNGAFLNEEGDCHHSPNPSFPSGGNGALAVLVAFDPAMLGKGS